jgi:hypothetical protein
VTITLLVAVALGAASALLRKSFGFYASPLSWAKRWSIAVIALYTLAGAATGLLGWWFGSWAHWHPDNDWVRGLLWGSFGAAVARTGFSAIPAEGTTDAISLLSTIGSFLTGGLRWGTERAARAYVSALPMPEFVRFVSEVWEGGARRDPRLSDDVQKEDAIQMRDLIGDIQSAAGEAEAARGRLTAKVVRWVAEYDVPRPLSSR